MTQKITLLIALILPAHILSQDLPTAILTKNEIKLYLDMSTTKNMGYHECDPYEDGEYLIIKNFIKPGNVIIDAGAHIGDWSKLALEQTNNVCSLYSFEPVPQFFQKLVNNINKNAHCFNIALGKNNTKLLMNYYYEESEGCSSLYERKVLSEIPVKKIMVPVTSLDIFCQEQNIDHIHFLKIDTEGAEWDVLQGAHHLITNKKIDYIQFEYGGTYPDANITLKQVYSYLTNQGYTIFRIAPDGLIFIEQWRDELENFHLSNYLAIVNNNH